VFLQGEGPWVVGSALECDIPIRAKGVSRRHVEFRRDGSGLRFKDLQSTNGCFLNGERVIGGSLDTQSVLQVGGAILRLANTATDVLRVGQLSEGLQLRSLMNTQLIATEHEPRDPNGRLFSFDAMARLVEDFLVEAKTAQEYLMLCRFLRKSLECAAVRCYEWQSEGLILKADEGSFPQERVSSELAQSMASLPRIAAFAVDGPGEPLSLLSIPILLDGKKVIFLGAANGIQDPIARYQEILPILYVECRLVLTWAEELRAKETAVGELRERIRGAEAGLATSADDAEPIVGRCEALLRETGSADQAAATEIAVLICGPTGAGKELIARRIHRRSNRAAGPFVPLNCASIPESLLESELFGVERGAYTGADRSRVGFFEKASGGTLFLDEVGDLPISLQPKLLRVLEEKRFAPLGTTKTRPVDVRILGASNQDLQAAIRNGRFRKDLYYRLAGLLLHLPPLSERGEDVLLLANYFVQVANREFGKRVQGFEEDAVDVLRRYAWPGNVRQLQAIVKQLVLMSAETVITHAAVEAALRRHHPGEEIPRCNGWDKPWPEAKEEFEQEYLKHRLEAHKGSTAALAREMGITRPNLYIKLRKFGLKIGRD
jgi:DNA-binding NtrC family response regulator